MATISPGLSPYKGVKSPQFAARGVDLAEEVMLGNRQAGGLKAEPGDEGNRL